jgi:hypothetical protein
MIELVNLDYQNFKDVRLPQVAVYSIFPHYVDKGLARSFRFNLRMFVEEHFKRFDPLGDTVIVSESRFLEEVESDRFQAVKVNLPSNLSFHDVTSVVASIHFEEFLKRHPWLSSMGGTQVG